MAERQTPLPVHLQAADRLLASARGREQADAVWIEFTGRMRQAVGTGHTDRRVPFTLGPKVARAAAAAQGELVELLRHRADGFPGRVRERNFGLRGLREGTPEHRVVGALLGADPLLDAGILEPWIRGGAGGGLLGILSRYYRNALEEEVRLEGTEPTAWAAHVALTHDLRARKEALKQETIRGIGYEALERAVGVALGAILAFASEEAMGELRERGVLGAAEGSCDRIAAAISPLAMTAIQSAALRPAPNPWGLPRELVVAIDALGVDPLAPDGDARTKIVAALGKIERSREVKGQALDVGGLMELRGLVFRYLREYDVGHEPRHEALANAVLGMHSLSAAIGNAKTFEAGWSAAASLAADGPASARANAQSLAEAFDGASRRRGPWDPAAALVGVAASWLTFRYDRWAEEGAEAARARMVDRASEFAGAELKAHYDAGRVYRFATDEHPILVDAAKLPEEGHLFLDLKGFTRLVALAKESNTVEFMKHVFYAPVLEKAKAYRDIGRRLELNNLLGDAVSFSGDVVALVALAEDVNDLFIDYEHKLRERGMQATRVEAGLFIAFGAPAESIHVESEGWGDAGFTEAVDLGGGARAQRIKVAIAEKINESARGTARNGTVFARVKTMAMLEAVRRGEKEPRELPWSVYVERVPQLALPPKAIDALDRAVEDPSEENRAAAGALIGDIVRDALAGTESARALYSPTSDLYNVGRALSREALDAFVAGTKTIRLTVEKTLDPASLPPSFARFFFPEREIRLLVSYDTGKAPRAPIVFRYAGDLQFRGFEGLRTTAIYEILDPSSPIYTLLARHFLPTWHPRP